MEFSPHIPGVATEGAATQVGRGDPEATDYPGRHVYNVLNELVETHGVVRSAGDGQYVLADNREVAA
ncbi:hypothetical protein [Micromonospora inyonensis]|uniref:hypothetical protein n=1 Tax=Micromonospora inyonensis TaxID=47866 RepID=UPI00114CC9E0|nr:hypothetical protein [Micromonospora inyonensis]